MVVVVVVVMLVVVVLVVVLVVLVLVVVVAGPFCPASVAMVQQQTGGTLSPAATQQLSHATPLRPFAQTWTCASAVTRRPHRRGRSTSA